MKPEIFTIEELSIVMDNSLTKNSVISSANMFRDKYNAFNG